MKRVFLAILILLLFGVSSFGAPLPKKAVKRGNVLYNKGEFKEALKEYEEALLKSPDSEVVNFNLGTALYKTKDYKAALRHFEKSLVSEDESLEQNASYNVGNAEYKYGIAEENENLEEAISLLKRSLGHYENAIIIDSEDEDAKYNYEFVKKELRRLLKKKEEKKEEEKEKEGKDKDKEGEGKEEEGKDKGEEEKTQEEKKEEDRKEEQKQEERAREEEKKEEPGEAKDEKQGTSGEEGEDGQVPLSREKEISEKEAEMLLNQYRYEEEPKGLYKEKVPLTGFPEVLRDW